MWIYTEPERPGYIYIYIVTHADKQPERDTDTRGRLDVTHRIHVLYRKPVCNGWRWIFISLFEVLLEQASIDGLPSDQPHFKIIIIIIF